MPGWLDTIFHEYGPGAATYNHDPFVTALNAVGGVLIAITFFIIGFICASLAGTDAQSLNDQSSKRILLTRLFGWFLISCAVSRALGVVAIWHNFAMLNGIVQLVTGGISLFAVFIIPATIKESLKQRTLEEVEQKLRHTSDKLEKVKEISEKLENSRNAEHNNTSFNN